MPRDSGSPHLSATRVPRAPALVVIVAILVLLASTLLEIPVLRWVAFWGGLGTLILALTLMFGRGPAS